MRLIILCPNNFADYYFFRQEMNRLTIDAKDVVLVCGEEVTHPLALKWMDERWSKARRKGKHRFAVLRNHFLEHQKNKDEMYKQQWREMVQDAQAVIAFWETGNVDFRIKGILNMAKLFDLPTKKVLI